MTRLHAEIARSISFYRQNQSGGPPVRAFLCGGTVTLPYMIEFFSEKLQIPIEHFNSLRNVTVASEQMAAQVAGRAHMLGEVVGCALRFVGNTPIEINVRPHSLVREQDLSRRKPLSGPRSDSARCWLRRAGGSILAMRRLSPGRRLESVSADVNKLEAIARRFDALQAETKRLQETAAPLILAANERSAWAEILEELGSRLPPRFIWVTDLKPLSEGRPYPSTASTQSRTPCVPAELAARLTATSRSSDGRDRVPGDRCLGNQWALSRESPERKGSACH